MERKELLTIEEVAELTGFSVGSLYHWVSQGRIPVIRFSARCIRFRRSDIDAWLERLLVPSSGGIIRRER
jgi:excisionase family DNA binding protein